VELGPAESLLMGSHARALIVASPSGRRSPAGGHRRADQTRIDLTGLDSRSADAGGTQFLLVAVIAIARYFRADAEERIEFGSLADALEFLAGGWLAGAIGIDDPAVIDEAGRPLALRADVSDKIGQLRPAGL
jgi:hypothetical protein